MVRHLVLSTFVFILMSCASGGNSGNSISTITKGSKFVLKQGIAINSYHVHLQDGKIMNYANIDKYAPFCRFEVTTEGEQTIKPDTFTVTKVSLYEPQLFPGNYYVKFDLTAVNNPRVRSLACGAWSSATDNAYISFAQMQQALGNYFEIPKAK